MFTDSSSQSVDNIPILILTSYSPLSSDSLRDFLLKVRRLKLATRIAQTFTEDVPALVVPYGY